MAQKLTRVCFFYTPHQSGQVCFPEKIWYEDIDVDRSIIFFFFLLEEINYIERMN